MAELVLLIPIALLLAVTVPMAATDFKEHRLPNKYTYPLIAVTGLTLLGFGLPLLGHAGLAAGLLAVFALSEPGDRGAEKDAEHDGHDQENEQWRGDGQRLISRIERVEGQIDRGTVGNGQNDQQHSERKEYHEAHDFPDHLDNSLISSGPLPGPLRGSS